MKYLMTFAICAWGAAAAHAQGVAQGAANAPDFTPAWETQTRAPAQQSGISLNIQVLAQGLDTPWGVEVLPEGGYLVTERSGALRLVHLRTIRARPCGLVPRLLISFRFEESKTKKCHPIPNQTRLFLMLKVFFTRQATQLAMW